MLLDNKSRSHIVADIRQVKKVCCSDNVQCGPWCSWKIFVAKNKWLTFASRVSKIVTSGVAEVNNACCESLYEIAMG